MTLKTRPPTGRVPWPLILIEGAEKAGKSWACAELSASPKVGQTYWIDLGEGAADEYGAIPGARYLVVEHDGSFAAILAAVEEIKAIAANAASAGEPPIVLVIDSMTAEWEILKAVADGRARARLAQKGRTVAPDAEPQISMDLWNDVNSRHRKLMTHLMTFPGIVCVTARGKDVAALDAGGRPVEGSKEYRVDGQKNLAFDATVWLRVSRDHPPVVVGARSVHAGVRPGVDKPKSLPDLSLERVVFDILGCRPGQAQVRDLVQPQPSAEDMADPTPPEAPVSGPPRSGRLFELLAQADLNDKDKGLQFINEKIAPASVRSTKELTPEQVDLVVAALQRFIAQQEPAAAAAGVGQEAERPVASQKARRRMHALWGQLGYTAARRDERMELTRQMIRREITTSAELTPDEVAGVIEVLERRVQQQQQEGPPAQEAAPEPVRSGPSTVPQRRRITELLHAQGADTAAAMLPLINAALAPVSVRSLRGLTEAQADQVIAHLTREQVPA